MQTDNFNRDSGIPIYRQLADYLINQISSGVFKPGDVLPSEADIIRDFNISRTTARLAFGLLNSAGLIRREQGRGTIVVSQVRSRLPILSSVTEEISRFGRKPGSRFISKSIDDLSIEAANALKLNVNEKTIKIIRLRMADDEPLGVAVSWLNISRYPQLEKITGMDNSLYDVIENQFGLKIRSAVENIRADLAGDFESPYLGVKPGSPILRLARTTYVLSENEGGTPIEYAETAFNGLAYSVDVELFR